MPERASVADYGAAVVALPEELPAETDIRPCLRAVEYLVATDD